MKKISLVKARENKRCKIIEITAGLALQNKLSNMGIYPGKEITKLSGFALRGPVAIKVNRAVIALGHGMANKIFVEME